MASIASPRAIPASVASSPTASQRTSLDTTRTSSPARPAVQPQARRNRAALRDYYNLKPQVASVDQAPTVPSSSASVASEDAGTDGALWQSELDKPGFDAAAYVQTLLEKEGLQAVLKTEGILLNEIRELDGERKALVYDNYSKLIAATDTIRGMRANMVPLGANTGDLKNMVGRIAETARELSEGAAGQKIAEVKEQDKEEPTGTTQDSEKEERQRATVRWVVGAPARLRKLLGEDKTADAEDEWKKVSALLDKWAGVEGVKALRDQCVEALHRDTSTTED